MRLRSPAATALAAVAALVLPPCGGQQMTVRCDSTVVASPCDPHSWTKCPAFHGLNWYCGATTTGCDCSSPLQGTPATACSPALTCSTNLAHGVARTCASASRIAADQWCSSRCYEQLQPLMEQCQDSLPAYVLHGMAPAAARLDECAHSEVGVCVVAPGADTGGEGAAGEPACDIDRMIALCQGVVPSATDLTALCAAPCTRAMIACADDPQLAQLVQATEITAMRSAKNSCAQDAQAAGGAASTAGDGACDLVLVTTLCDADRSAVMATEDTAELCADPCAKEMLDCIDDPELVRFVQLAGTNQQPVLLAAT
jgi:hypothetical protein